MGKLFGRKNRHSDEEYDDEIYENDELEDEDGVDTDDKEAAAWDDVAAEEDSDEEDDRTEVEADEDEEDDGDDEDGDEEEVEEEEEIDEAEQRRIYRHRRRIRNQVIAYTGVLLLLAALAAVGVAGGMRISSRVQEKKAAQALAQMEADEEALSAQDMTIDTPQPLNDEADEEEDYLEKLVDTCISEMPIEDKVAGLFMITPEALTGVGTAVQAGEGTQNALNEYAVGGLIYFSQNISDREQITEMLSNTTSMSKYPIFLAVDEEGGSVSRVANSDVDVIKVDDMATIGATEDTTQAYEAGVTIGAYLSEIGFNVDFAPVADVVSEDGSSALQDRSFGSDAQTVSDMVANVVDGIEGTGVSSCLKHFPGIGSASEDTHEGRVEIDKTLDEMRQTDFLPFQAGIDAGADFVMVSHATAVQVDEDGLPSSLSSAIMTDILRDELNFEGVIITDALNMSAITDYYTSAEAAVKAIKAGADMLLMPEDFVEAYDAVLAAVQDGSISEDRIDESLRRIYRIKYADKLEK
jgi:beta-N-acetylhexosaminidase